MNLTNASTENLRVLGEMSNRVTEPTTMCSLLTNALAVLRINVTLWFSLMGVPRQLLAPSKVWTALFEKSLICVYYISFISETFYWNLAESEKRWQIYVIFAWCILF